eukprot:TRINITY_DN20578_c0_g1_i1.p1 TRINITY_DN20578_c0_g1~~TRINITY_DN20578_c0_g1_i1.p1  ORF type:complete len:727 (-),score=94.53 TRINITY_DN20578_c0_g1_i1:85-2265(-)
MHMRDAMHSPLSLLRLLFVATGTSAKSAADHFRVPAGKGSLNTAVHAWMENASHRGPGPVVFELSGTYYLNGPLILDDRAAGFHFVGSDATISGGAAVSGWVPVPTSGNISLWKASLPPTFNASDFGATLQMWRGETRLTVAQTPTLKYSRARKNDVTFKGTDIKATYRNFGDVALTLYESWTASYHLLKHVDAANHVAHLASPFNSKWANGASGSRFSVFNAFEELDSVNEFYVDRKEKAVYVGLAAGDDPNKHEPFTLAAGLRELVRIEGKQTAQAKEVTFSHVRFAHTAVEDQWIVSGASAQSASFLENAAIHVAFARDVVIKDCAFQAMGGYAVWIAEQTSQVSVVRSLLKDLGAGGIRLGRAEATQPECENHTISDNHITDGGHAWQEGCGVLAQKVGNVSISHNEISYMRYSGVSTGWTWGYAPTIVHDVLTAFNHIHHIGLGYLSDMGCVYTLGHQPGSVVRNNYCHDVQSYNYGGWAYYTDEGSRDELFENNIAHRTKCAGHHQHYGTDNILRNNLYVDVNIGDVPTPGRSEIFMRVCDGAIIGSTHGRNLQTCPDPHGSPHAGCCCHVGCDQGVCSSLSFTNNVVYLSKDSNSTFVATSFAYGLANFSFDNNVYFHAGVEPTAHMFNGTKSAPVGHGQESFDEWRKHGKDVRSLFADPKIDLVNYGLSADSPALKLGFKQINISQVGPRVGNFASAHPVAHEAAEFEHLMRLGFIVI